MEQFSCTRSFLCFSFLIDVFMLYWIFWYLRVIFSLPLKDILSVFENSFFHLNDILAFVLKWYVKTTKEVFLSVHVKNTAFVSAGLCICFIGIFSICKAKCTIMFCICKPLLGLFVYCGAQVIQVFFVREEGTYLYIVLSSFLPFSRPPTYSAASAGQNKEKVFNVPGPSGRRQVAPHSLLCCCQIAETWLATAVWRWLCGDQRVETAARTRQRQKSVVDMRAHVSQQKTQLPNIYQWKVTIVITCNIQK